MRGEPKFDVSKRQIQFLSELLSLGQNCGTSRNFHKNPN